MANDYIEGIIYKWTNTINGKIYIGQTVRPEIRYKRHLDDAFKNDSQFPFHKALRKYGTDNFTYEVIEKVPVAELDERETYWIAYYDSYSKGYNATKGGEGNRGYIWSDEAKARHSEIMTEVNRRIFKGKPSPNKGKKLRPHTQEELDKMSNKVYQYSLDGELLKVWDSTAECGRNGHNQGHVAACCRGEEKTHHKCFWSYKPLIFENNGK